LYFHNCEGLIYQRTGCTSFEEWRVRHPTQVAYTRQMIEVSISFVEHTHVEKYWAEPIMYFGCGDLRRPLAERLGLGEHLCGRQPCCHRYGMARDLHEEGRTPAWCVRPRTTVMWYFVSWILYGSIGGIERLHACSRRVADPMNTWTTFVSNFINKQMVSQVEEKERLRKRRELLVKARLQLTDCYVAPEDQLAVVATHKRARKTEKTNK
jgi:hypothetical protein